jgi:bifunctional non-homologous end joining protein LigD
MLFDLLGENAIELPIIYSEHLTGDGQEMFENAGKFGWDGIVSKNAEAPYRSERNQAWLKVMRDEGEISGRRISERSYRVAALYLGRRRQRFGLHGQSGDRLESHYFKPN